SGSRAIWLLSMSKAAWASRVSGDVVTSGPLKTTSTSTQRRCRWRIRGHRGVLRRADELELPDGRSGQHQPAAADAGHRLNPGLEGGGLVRAGPLPAAAAGHALDLEAPAAAPHTPDACAGDVARSASEARLE